MKYFFEVKSYRFVPENYREQRTAMHYSDFSGHKKQYQLLINGAETQLTWVKGFLTPLRFRKVTDSRWRAKSPSKWLCVEPVTERRKSAPCRMPSVNSFRYSAHCLLMQLSS